MDTKNNVSSQEVLNAPASASNPAPCLADDAEQRIHMRLILDIDYSLNGESPKRLAEFLHALCDHAAGNGMLTHSSLAEVDGWEAQAVQMPDPIPKEDLAEFMLRRIENGQLSLEDIAVSMARYGLEEPHKFMSEMRERMDQDNDN